MTGACAEVLYLTGAPEHAGEPDYDRPVSNAELVEAMEARLRRLAEDERVDEPVSPRNAFDIQLPYIGREDAVRLYGEGDPEVDVTHVFQGDIFHSLQLMAPRPGGVPDWVLSAGLVVSHHCEWTKAKTRFEQGADWPILLAPVHDLDAFQSHERRLIRDNQFRYYLHLPAEEPIDRELVADLRLTQPVSALDLRDSAYWATLDQDLHRALKAKVAEYVWRDFTLE